VKLDWLHRRAREIGDDLLREVGVEDFERLMVGDAVVTRVGGHYRIESGGETWAELERLAAQATGRDPAGAGVLASGPVGTTAIDSASEAEQVSRLRAGDPVAYEWLVRAHIDRLLAVARRVLRSEADAQDAVQEAFLSAFRAIDSFQGESRLSTWLHRIALNAALGRLRSRTRRQETSLEDLTPAFLEDGHHVNPPVAWKASPQELLEHEETRARVRAAIDRLPESQRTILTLRDIEGLDTNEAAELLGITPNAAKIRLHRARIALRQLLDPFARERNA
jgi:RNA polymerase sigma-70 factor (ECF subfamily)